MRNECEVCGKQIEVMIFRGTGVCSDDCRKRKSDLVPTTKPKSNARASKTVRGKKVVQGMRGTSKPIKKSSK